METTQRRNNGRRADGIYKGAALSTFIWQGLRQRQIDSESVIVSCKGVEVVSVCGSVHRRNHGHCYSLRTN